MNQLVPIIGDRTHFLRRRRGRSKLLKGTRFGDFLRSTLSWWRSDRISASSETRDRNSPMTVHQIWDRHHIANERGCKNA